MPLPIHKVQQALKEDGVDGWLLYDCHGSNPIARQLVGLGSTTQMTTRRWYYLIPAKGEPRGLVHAIESHNLDGVPGTETPYAGRELLVSGLRDLLRGMKQVDRASRDVIERAGYGAQFIHRTGHSLGEEVHGNGVHMDDYETHDERRPIPGTGFTIEPGVYTSEFGVRTEINMFIGPLEAEVTGPLQTELVTLG